MLILRCHISPLVERENVYLRIDCNQNTDRYFVLVSNWENRLTHCQNFVSFPKIMGRRRYFCFRNVCLNLVNVFIFDISEDK